jgi:hypothetical protein
MGVGKPVVLQVWVPQVQVWCINSEPVWTPHLYLQVYRFGKSQSHVTVTGSAGCSLPNPSTSVFNITDFNVESEDNGRAMTHTAAQLL